MPEKNEKANQVVSIQVSAVIVNGGGVKTVSLSAPDITHISVYYRYASGEAHWLRDYDYAANKDAVALALVYAAKHSMRLGVPIEAMEGLRLTV